MKNRGQIPSVLSVVAAIFLVLAIIAVAEMVYSLLSGSLRFQFNALGFWIYFGLRRFSAGWRTCALVLIWIQLIMLPVMFVFSIASDGVSLDCAADAALFLLGLWLYQVLMRPSIRGLFYDQSQIPAA
jgi:hypothetical protein